MSRWRQGETVKPEEQVSLVEGPDVITPITASVEGNDLKIKVTTVIYINTLEI